MKISQQHLLVRGVPFVTLSSCIHLPPVTEAFLHQSDESVVLLSAPLPLHEPWFKHLSVTKTRGDKQQQTATRQHKKDNKT